MTMEENENQADQAQKELVESKMSNRNRHSHTYNEGRARLTVESQLDFLEKVVVTNDTIIAWPIRCTDPPVIVQQNDGVNRIANGTSNTGLQPPADSPKEAVLANEKNHPNVSVEVKVDSIAVQNPTNCHALDIQARVQIKQKFNSGRYTQTGTSEFSNTEQKNAVSEVDKAKETDNLGARPMSPIHSFKSCLAFCSPTDPNISGSLTIQGHISPDGRLLITPGGVTTDDRTQFPSQSGHHHERTEAISGSDQGELKSVEPGKTGSIVDPEKSITYVRPGSNCEVQVQENCTFDQNPDGALELRLSRMLQIQPTNQKDDTEHVDGQAIMDTEKVQQLGSPEQTEKEPLGLSVEQADGSRLNESLEMRQTEIETDIPPEVVSPARVSETSIQIADQQADNADNTALASETVNIVDQEHNGVIEENKTTPRVSASSNRDIPNAINETDVSKTSVEEKEKEDNNEQKEDSGLEKCPEQLEGVENVDNIQVVEKMDTIGQQKAPEVEVDNETDDVRNLPISDQLDQEGITSVVQNENLGPPEATAIEMEQSVEQQVGEGDEGLPTSLMLGTTEQGEEGWAPTDVQEPQEVESPTAGAETPTKQSEEKTVDVVETGQSDQVNVAESAELNVEKQVAQEVDEGERKLVESQLVDTTEQGEEGLAFTDAEELREQESPISDEEKPSKTQESMEVDVTVEPSEVAKPETTWEAPEEKSAPREPENKQERPELKETEPTNIRRLSTTSDSLVGGCSPSLHMGNLDWIKLNPSHFLQRSSRNEESNANKRPKRHFSSCSSKDLMRNIGNYAQYKSVVNKHNQGGVIPAIEKFGNKRPNLCCDCSSESKYLARLCATKAGDVSYSKQRCFNKRVPSEDKRTLEKPDTNGQCHNARSTQVLHEAVEEDEIPLVPTELNLCSISQTQTPIPQKNQTIGPFASMPEFDLHDSPQKSRWFESNYKRTKPDRYFSSLSQDISADCSTQSEQSSHLSNQCILECHKSGQQECHENLVRPMLCPSTRYKMVTSKNDSDVNAKLESQIKQNRTTRTTCCSVQGQSHRQILHLLHGESSAVQKIHDVLVNSPPASLMSESEDNENLEADHSVVSGTTSASKE
ncbi:hypothetical protein FGIG_11953 [Fasciola gigantica]|uniref:Uncharacterized protein n=1 Tax=Fasciola gigantica TaxID=46835 RepID=A0A504YP49_FASGI|nr:hypothetical protein FGIG_11953 [Fasciola gigantica]